MSRFALVTLLFVITGCPLVIKEPTKPTAESPVQLVVLGNVQDAGSPHIGCPKSCCAKLFDDPDPNRLVVSLGVIDHQQHASYLFDASPDITRQIKMLKQQDTALSEMPNGIFLTHAHIGHYTGLMYLGKEAISAYCVPVYAMPRMKDFLTEDGPWSQLVELNNIDLMALSDRTSVTLGENITVTPFRVPHRDEFSETVGYTITGPAKTALFIPDIDKWSKWNKNIIEEVATVDYAFVDATFYDGNEIQSRDISEIPHPFVVETMALFSGLPHEERQKVHFIHFNHTNPLLDEKSKQTKVVLDSGYNIARLGDSFGL